MYVFIVENALKAVNGQFMMYLTHSIATIFYWIFHQIGNHTLIQGVDTCFAFLLKIEQNKYNSIVICY